MLRELMTLVSGLYSVGLGLGTVDYVLAEKYRREQKKLKKPFKVVTPHKKINILLPALFEKDIIASTLDNVATLDHPNYKVTVITHLSDPKTAEAAMEHIKKMGYKNVEVKRYDYKPMTKPSALDYAFSDLEKDFDIIGILDAENKFERKDVLKSVETYFENSDVGAVQIRIVPVYEKNGWWRQLIQLTACVEFANLYSLPLRKVEEGKKPKEGKTVTNIVYSSQPNDKEKRRDNLFIYGKMSIKNRFTTAFLGGTGCFYSANTLRELAKIREEEREGRGFVPGPFDPHGLVEDFQSAVDIIGRLSKPKKVVYDPKDNIYAYFPDTFTQRLKQATRWSTGKLRSMLRTNIFKLRTNKAKKFEVLREYFFNAVPVVNFAAVGYLGWSTASNYLGIVPPAPDSDLVWIMLVPGCYAVVLTLDQVYKTCNLYGKKILSKDAGKYFVASIFNQWILQPLANLRAYGKILYSYATGKTNEWEKTSHQKINIYNTEGVNNHNINGGVNVLKLLEDNFCELLNGGDVDLGNEILKEVVSENGIHSSQITPSHKLLAEGILKRYAIERRSFTPELEEMASQYNSRFGKDNIEYSLRLVAKEGSIDLYKPHDYARVWKSSIPKRNRILELLKRGYTDVRSTCDEIPGSSYSSVYYHLKKLEEEGYVKIYKVNGHLKLRSNLSFKEKVGNCLTSFAKNTNSM